MKQKVFSCLCSVHCFYCHRHLSPSACRMSTEASWGGGSLTRRSTFWKRLRASRTVHSVQVAVLSGPWAHGPSFPPHFQSPTKRLIARVSSFLWAYLAPFVFCIVAAQYQRRRGQPCTDVYHRRHQKGREHGYSSSDCVLGQQCSSVTPGPPHFGANKRK